MQFKLKTQIFSFVIFSSLSYGTAKAQLIEKIDLVKPKYKVTNSLYNKIVVLDSRSDTTTVGAIQKGAFNRKAKVVLNQSWNKATNDLLSELTDATAGSNELLLQLRQLSFLETSSMMSEQGYFGLRANLYVRNNTGYLKIADIDTIAFVSSAIDVSNPLLKKGSEVLTSFISRNLKIKPQSESSYSYNDILRIDSLEKSKLKIYTENAYSDGFYNSYNSFFNQKPDGAIVVEKNIEQGGSVKITDEKGKLKKLKAGSVYAIVHQGKPYIATAYGYYPLTKTDNELYFMGKAHVQPSSGTIMMAQAAFGIVGGLLASAGSDAIFYMKIDHVNGSFIRLRQIGGK